MSVTGEEATVDVLIVVRNTLDLGRRRKEGTVLFNDALNTFYLLLYGIRHMEK